MFIKWVNTIGSWFIPLFILIVFLHGIYKKVPLYDTFIEGAKEGFQLVIKILPYVVGIYVAVGIFRNSGALQVLLYPIKPLLSIFNIPNEVIPLMVVRLLSGPAALGLTAELINEFGPDSFIGRLASTLDGSIDTALYIIAVYAASVGLRDTRYILPVALLSAISGYTASIIICKLVF